MNFKLAMNTGTFNLHNADLSKMLHATSENKFTGIEIRDNHIQEFINKGHSNQDVKNLLKTHELHPVAYHSLRDWQYLETNKKKGRKSAERFLQECKEIGFDSVACPTFAEDGDVQRDIRCFKEICDIGKAFEINILLEFLPWVELKDIGRAWEVMRKAERSNGGLIIDVFHYFKGGSRIEDLREVPIEKIFVVHLNDAFDYHVDLKETCMKHRVFPGEADFPLVKFLDVLILEKKYSGWFSLEVLNKEYKKDKYSEIGRKGQNSLKDLFSRYNA